MMVRLFDNFSDKDCYAVFLRDDHPLYDEVIELEKHKPDLQVGIMRLPEVRDA